MTDPPDISPRDRLVVATGHAVSAVFLALGILGSLRTHLDHVAQLAMFTVSPGIAVAWLVIGVVGLPEIVAARLLVLLDGAGAEFFVRDIPLVTLHLVAGAVSVAACLVPGAAPMPQNPSGSSPERTP